MCMDLFIRSCRGKLLKAKLVQCEPQLVPAELLIPVVRCYTKAWWSKVNSCANEMHIIHSTILLGYTVGSYTIASSCNTAVSGKGACTYYVISLGGGGRLKAHLRMMIIILMGDEVGCGET